MKIKIRLGLRPGLTKIVIPNSVSKEYASTNISGVISEDHPQNILYFPVLKSEWIFSM